MSFSEYQTLVFDCDGVVLNSNRCKTQAFYQAALSYGEDAANALVDYHTANGGVSRYKKFAYFLEQIVPQHAPNSSGPDMDALLAHYASEVRQGLMQCEVAPGLQALREQTPGANWLIVSGGDQNELREIFSERGLSELFDGGIFGSPDSKDEILSREVGQGVIREPALFLGDSKYDHQAASAAGFDFVFLSGWTEVSDWESWAASNQITTCENVDEFGRRFQPVEG